MQFVYVSAGIGCTIEPTGVNNTVEVETGEDLTLTLTPLDEYKLKAIVVNGIYEVLTEEQISTRTYILTNIIETSSVTLIAEPILDSTLTLDKTDYKSFVSGDYVRASDINRIQFTLIEAINLVYEKYLDIDTLIRSNNYKGDKGNPGVDGTMPLAQISEQNTWMVWDVIDQETGATGWVDTAISVLGTPGDPGTPGTPGQDGDTVTINPTTKMWEINEVNTGVKAAGTVVGVDLTTECWVFDGIVSNIKARGPRGIPGPKGDPGEQGDPGVGLTIAGKYNTYAELLSGGDPAYAYLVKVPDNTGPYNIYINLGAWENMGQMQGTAGLDGKTALQYATDGGFSGSEEQFDNALAAILTTTSKAGTASQPGHAHATSDITGFPVLGTVVAKNVAVTGNASTTEVVMGNDTRLSDARAANGGNSDTVDNKHAVDLVQRAANETNTIIVVIQSTQPAAVTGAKIVWIKV